MYFVNNSTCNTTHTYHMYVIRQHINYRLCNINLGLLFFVVFNQSQSQSSDWLTSLISSTFQFVRRNYVKLEPWMTCSGAFIVDVVNN